MVYMRRENGESFVFISATIQMNTHVLFFTKRVGMPPQHEDTNKCLSFRGSTLFSVFQHNCIQSILNIQ